MGMIILANITDYITIYLSLSNLKDDNMTSFFYDSEKYTIIGTYLIEGAKGGRYDKSILYCHVSK